MVKAQSTQQSFVVGNGIILYILNTGDRVPIILEEKKWNAEILHAVNVVTFLIHAPMAISGIDKCFLTLTQFKFFHKPFLWHIIIRMPKKLFLLFLLLFCVVRTQKIVWFRKKVPDVNFMICCNYVISLDKGTKNAKKIKLLVVYSQEEINEKIQMTSCGSF